MAQISCSLRPVFLVVVTDSFSSPHATSLLAVVHLFVGLHGKWIWELLWVKYNQVTISPSSYPHRRNNRLYLSRSVPNLVCDSILKITVALEQVVAD